MEVVLAKVKDLVKGRMVRLSDESFEKLKMLGGVDFIRAHLAKSKKVAKAKAASGQGLKLRCLYLRDEDWNRVLELGGASWLRHLIDGS